MRSTPTSSTPPKPPWPPNPGRHRRAQRQDALDRPRIHADAELDVDPTVSLTEAHRIAHDAEHTLTHAVPKLSSALIHAYPATIETH
jgi:divalent metal cation (Fe/Co/Zn/Cd) transporter